MRPKASMNGPLDGWRALEVADSVSASFCAKILSDLGAEVLKIEPPGGHGSRRSFPRHRAEESCHFLYLNTGKESVVVPDDADGDAALRRLLDETDVLITDGSSRSHALNDVPPHVVWASIRPFGAWGPYAGYQSTHLIVFHAGTEGSILPSGPGFATFPERPPIQLGSDIADYDTGWNAAVAVLAGCHDRQRSGIGQRIDVSAQESELTLNRTRLSRFNNDGIVLHREANRYGIAGTLRCRDGWVQLAGLRDDHWDALLARPQGRDFADGRFATSQARHEHQEALGEALASWCASRSKNEVVEVLAGVGAAVGSYATPAEIISSAQLAHRAFFRQVPHRERGTITLPGVPYRFSRTPVVLRAAPDLGSATGFRPTRTPRSRSAFSSAPRSGLGEPAAVPRDGGRMLEGIRVLDFTWAAAGPYATLLLGFLGAEVIKVESSRRLDPARRGFLADYGGPNRSPNFNELNLNKRSFQVDLSRPEGREVVAKLVPLVDVVVDNFRPGVMARLGFDAQTLLAMNPRLVVASSSAYGSTGPQATGAGLASIFSAAGGLGHQTGYADGPPTEVGESTDYRSANALTVAILAALLDRMRTGQGQAIDLSSTEVIVASAPDAVLAELFDIAWTPRLGNRHRELAPHDVYPCSGEDQWVALAVRHEDDWRALCAVIGRADWETRYRSARERMGSIGVIDQGIAAWTRQRSPSEAFLDLQGAGVPAAPVLTNAQAALDPHLAARGTFVKVVHPEIGTQTVMRAPWLFSDWKCLAHRHGPLLGQDNDYVLGELLGMDPSQWRSLAGVFR